MNGDALLQPELEEVIKVYENPEVKLLSYTNGLDHPVNIPFTSDAPSSAEALVEFAGRLCYLSFGAGMVDGHKTIAGRTTNGEYIANLKRTKHGSVLEHANFTFLFQGISRSLSHELVRHRHLSFSQLSQRYVDESFVAFVLPPEVKTSYERSIWEYGCRNAQVQYRVLLDAIVNRIHDEEVVAGQEPTNPTELKKRARQTARSLLPNCAETKIVVTGNARAWRHFLFLRASRAADTEIRKLAVETGFILRNVTPNLFGDWEMVHHDDGVITLQSEFGSF